MPTMLSVRTDEAMEIALSALAGEHRTRSEAVRYALLRTYRETVIEQAQQDTDRLESAPAEKAELLAIQRFMGVSK